MDPIVNALRLERDGQSGQGSSCQICGERDDGVVVCGGLVGGNVGCQPCRSNLESFEGRLEVLRDAGGQNGVLDVSVALRPAPRDGDGLKFVISELILCL